MDPTYSPEAEAYRAKITTFLAEHLPADWQGLGALEPAERAEFVESWRKTLAANELLAVAWPKEYGGPGLSPGEQSILSEEFTKAGVPQGVANDGFGIGMVGPTIMVWGTEEQKKHYIPRILSGEDRWCQGYSEPDAGSDLANLGCRAVLDGDEWVVNGQKIWTSAGHTANWIFVLCRTSPQNVKHAGISFLLVPMDQPGVEVRPIVNIIGGHEFNEVFFTDARTPKANVIGEVDNGWAVANTLLGFERGGRASSLYLTYREELDRLLAVARERGAVSQPRVRQQLAWAHTQVEVMRYMGLRTLTRTMTGERPGPEASLMKLMWSEYHRVITQLAVDVYGTDGLLMEGRAAASGIAGDAVGSPSSSRSWNEVAMRARAGTIYAGTSQVQRNIIGERVLGLPKEPRTDDGPWRKG